jgi:uncharacterized protein YjbI with pentapeptide repeats
MPRSGNDAGWPLATMEGAIDEPKSTRRPRPTKRRRSPFRGDEIHLQVLKACLRDRDRNAWNRWRRQNPGVVVDLRGAVLAGAVLARWNLAGAVLDGADLMRADLRGADLRGASLRRARLVLAALCNAKAGDADFRGANCRQAHFEQATCRDADFRDAAYLSEANLTESDFRGAHLDAADLSGATLRRTKLDGATLRDADLSKVVLDETSLAGADLRGAIVVDALIRRVRTDDRTDQRGLFVDLHMAWERRPGERLIFAEADDLRVAQFHSIVDEPGAVGKLLMATTQRVVLLLGRFTPARKAVLQALARALGRRGKIAIIFDFPAPEQREISDTVRFIAGMSEFIVVDLTDASSVPLELQATVPELMVPVLPIVQAGRRAFAMFSDLQRRYFWVQPTVEYRSRAELVRHVDEAIIARAREAARTIDERRASTLRATTLLQGERRPRDRRTR